MYNGRKGIIVKTLVISKTSHLRQIIDIPNDIIGRYNST